MWKNFVVHPQTATHAALAACAANKQGKFFELQRLIWDKSWSGGRLGDLSADTMTRYATDLHLDLGKFKADMNSQACKSEIVADQRLMAQVGTRGTPAFYINGRFLSGAQPIERFKAVIDQEMKKAEAALKSGKRPADYYSGIVAAGKKSI